MSVIAEARNWSSILSDAGSWASIIGLPGSLYLYMKFSVFAAKHTVAMAQSVKASGLGNTFRNIFSSFWTVFIFWLLNLISTMRGEEIDKMFVFSILINILVLQLLIIGYILKQWFGYINRIAELENKLNG